MGVRLEVQLAPAAIGYVGVELGRCPIRVAEHFLNRPEIGAPFQQMGREGVAEQMWVDAPRLEAGGRGEAPQDEECACSCEPAALRVQEELGPVALVQIGATAGEVAPECLGRLAADRNDPLLRPLADTAHEPFLEVDGALPSLSPSLTRRPAP